MKKLIPFLLASLFACWSCNLDDTYTQTNVREMVNVEGAKLLNDYGYELTVVEDQVGAANWQIDGARYLALYDILNRNLDIRLKEVIRSYKQDATLLGDGIELPQGPVELFAQGISGPYYNVGFNFYRAKNSNYAHPIHFYYKIVNNHLYIYIAHADNGENPVQMSEDDLVTESRMFSIPTDNFTNVYRISLVLYSIFTNADGTKRIEQETLEVN